MKQLIRDILISFFMGLAVPTLVLNLAAALFHRHMDAIAVVEAPAETVAVEEPGLPVRIRTGERVEEGDLEEYLVGVVLAEMPASFEPEALKAQSVVARTYAWKAWLTGGKHGDGSVCTDSACCQAFTTEEAYLKNGGTGEHVEKIRTAVFSTAGEILTYEGQPIEATYFSCSGGSTEDAAAVWGTEFPYLQAVDSPGEENAAYYRSTREFTRQEVEAALDVSLTGNPETWICAVVHTEGGGVDSICIGGKTFRGTQIRSLLGLRSAAFTMEASEAGITVTTRGFGHRVGMSQYGADAMAVTGSTYKEILAHYYQGTQLTQLQTSEDK